MGIYKVTIEKFLNGESYGTNEYFIDGTFVSDFNEAGIRALDEAQFEDEDEFNEWKIISVNYFEDN